MTEWLARFVLAEDGAAEVLAPLKYWRRWSTGAAGVLAPLDLRDLARRANDNFPSRQTAPGS